MLWLTNRTVRPERLTSLILPRHFFWKARSPTAQFGPAGGRLGDPGEDLQEGGLAGAVAADDADDLAGPDLQGHVAQGPQGAPRRLRHGRAPAPQAPPRGREGAGDRLPQRPV